MNKPTTIPFCLTVKFDNAVFLEILNRYGAAGWNSWIDAINKQNLVFPSWDIRFNAPSFQIEFILDGIDLSSRNLDNIDLTLVYISKGNFNGSSLYGAKFLIARNCDFSSADLRTAFFNSCNVSNCVFIDALIDNVTWERAYFYVGHKPIGLPPEITARLTQLEPDTVAVAEQKKIGCQAEIQDASFYGHMKED